MSNHIVYLSLGSNLGNREQLLRDTIKEIEKMIGEVSRQSSFYETEPWGFSSVHSFVNAAVCCVTSLSPQQLLSATQSIEREMGRTEKTKDGEYHDRIIDIDILLYDDISVHDDNLIIPHPLMKQRDFVMIPLKEIYQEQV